MEEILYSIKEIIETYDCSPFVLRNYIFKNKVGTRIDKKVYLNYQELSKFLAETELKNEKRRDKIYEVIKKHPSIQEKDLYKHLNIGRCMISSLLADMSYIPKYRDLYEDDDGGLFVLGYDEVEKEGLFE